MTVSSNRSVEALSWGTVKQVVYFDSLYVIFSKYDKGHQWTIFVSGLIRLFLRFLVFSLFLLTYLMVSFVFCCSENLSTYLSTIYLRTLFSYTLLLCRDEIQR